MSDDLRDEYLAERGFLVQRYVFCDQPRGVSSDALVKAALFPDYQPRSDEFPRDFADLGGRQQSEPPGRDQRSGSVGRVSGPLR